ncbi:MAG: DUF29 domain-containing protein [Massilia sp.]
MGTPYETDIVAWANEQANLLRQGKFSDLDIFHLADEIEDVAKTGKFELSDRLSALLAMLIRWRFEPGGRCEAWRDMIDSKRHRVIDLVEESPSLLGTFHDAEAMQLMWSLALVIIRENNGMVLPEEWIWNVEQVLDGGCK